MGKLHLKQAQQGSEQNCQQQKWLARGDGSVMKPRWPSCWQLQSKPEERWVWERRGIFHPFGLDEFALAQDNEKQMSDRDAKLPCTFLQQK